MIYLKKFKSLLIIILFIITLNGFSYASTINVLNTNVNNKIINEDIKFTKKIVSYDKENQEIEIELKIENIKKNVKDKEDIEIAVVLDNSSSMQESQQNQIKKDTTYQSANRFINLVYANIYKLKLGVIQFSDNSQVLTELTNSKQTAFSALDIYNNDNRGGNTKIAEALDSAEKLFSQNCKNKILILVTDGYPSDPSNTIQKLESLKTENISVLSLIIGSDSQQIKSIFGTEQNPRAGKVYYISNASEIDKMFNEFMYNQIIDYMQHPIKDIRIEDVFPKEILEYFDIEYGNIPGGSNVSDIGDGDSFTWHIDELTGEEYLVFSYKIKLKKNVDVNQVVGEMLKTNERVVIKYKDENGNEKEEVFDKNPSILVEDEGQNPPPNIQLGVYQSNDFLNSGNMQSSNESNNYIENEYNIQSEGNQQFVIVDFTPKDTETTETQEIKPAVQKENITPVNEEKLPQTGTTETITIAIIVSILIAIRLGFLTKDIYVVKK